MLHAGSHRDTSCGQKLKARKQQTVMMTGAMNHANRQVLGESFLSLILLRAKCNWPRHQRLPTSVSGPNLSLCINLLSQALLYFIAQSRALRLLFASPWPIVGVAWPSTSDAGSNAPGCLDVGHLVVGSARCGPLARRQAPFFFFFPLHLRILRVHRLFIRKLIECRVSWPL